MKKIYMSPETFVVKMATQTMIAASVEGFNKEVDDENPIDPNDMLAPRRRRDVWDEEEEVQEEQY